MSVCESARPYVHIHVPVHSRAETDNQEGREPRSICSCTLGREHLSPRFARIVLLSLQGNWLSGGDPHWGLVAVTLLFSAASHWKENSVSQQSQIARNLGLCSQSQQPVTSRGLSFSDRTSQCMHTPGSVALCVLLQEYALFSEAVSLHWHWWEGKEVAWSRVRSHQREKGEIQWHNST